MKIGIDLNDVLIETFAAVAKYHNSKFGTSYEVKDITNYFVWKGGLFKNKEEAISEIISFQESEVVTEMVLCEGVLEALDNSSKKNELIIITSRHDVLKDKTQELLESHFKNFNFSVRYSGNLHRNKKCKADLCLEEGCEIMIEDRHETALECAKKGVKAILLDKPWNQEEKTHENLIRVKNWKEALEKIKEIENEN